MPLTALIGSNGRPVAMCLGPKKREKKTTERDNFTHAQTYAPLEPTDPYICMWGEVADIINCAKFRDNPSKGFGAIRPPKTAFPIENVHRPYNSVGTTVP